MFKKIAIVLYLLMAVNVSANDFLISSYWKTASIQDVKNQIASGVDINARDKDGWTILMWAAGENENPEIITTLVNARADINARNKYGLTALMVAAFSNENPEIIKTLLDAGADIKARDKDGTTALMFAAYNNKNSDIVLTLLALGADAGAKDNKGKAAYDIILKNDALKESEARWKLNDLQYK